MNELNAVVAMVGIVGLVIFGTVAVLKGLRPKLDMGADKVSIETE